MTLHAHQTKKLETANVFPPTAKNERQSRRERAAINCDSERESASYAC